MIIFVEDGTNLKDRRNKNETRSYVKDTPNNVAININKYIAKYDFEVARKLRQNEAGRDIQINEPEPKQSINYDEP